jgi:hypothetical protein
MPVRSRKKGEKGRWEEWENGRIEEWENGRMKEEAIR